MMTAIQFGAVYRNRPFADALNFYKFSIFQQGGDTFFATGQDKLDLDVAKDRLQRISVSMRTAHPSSQNNMDATDYERAEQDYQALQARLISAAKDYVPGSADEE